MSVLQSGDNVPQNLVYDIQQGSKVILDRTRIKDSLLGYTSYANGLGPQKSISIATSSRNFIHGQSMRLDFNFQVTDASGAPIGNDNLRRRIVSQCGLHSIIQDMRLLNKSGQEIESIRDYNKLAMQLYDACVSHDWIKSCGFLEGFGLETLEAGTTVFEGQMTNGLLQDSDGNVPANTGGYGGSAVGVDGPLFSRFSLPLHFGLLQSDKLIPNDPLGLRVEIRLADANMFILSAAGNNYSYRKWNVELCYDECRLSPEYEATFNQLLASPTGCLMSFSTYTGLSQVIPTGTKITSEITDSSKMLKSVYTTMSGDNTTGRLTSVNRMATLFGKEVKSVQYKIGSKLYPQNPLGSISDNTNAGLTVIGAVNSVQTNIGLTEMYLEYMDAWRRMKGNYNEDPKLNFRRYALGNFYTGIDVEKSPYDSSDSGWTGISVVGSPIRLSVEFFNPPNMYANTQTSIVINGGTGAVTTEAASVTCVSTAVVNILVTHHLLHQRLLRIKSGGAIEVNY